MRFTNIEDTRREADLVGGGKVTLVWDMQLVQLEAAVNTPRGDVQKWYKRVCSVGESPLLGIQDMRAISIYY